MNNEKIDHHFNELSPVDFNIYGDMSLVEKLKKEGVSADKAQALRDHISVIKEQVESVLNEEDEHLAVVYNFLSHGEQRDYLNFLNMLEKDIETYHGELTNDK